MAATSLVESSQAARYRTTSDDCSGINEDLLKSIESSGIGDKIDFFRFMGLEIIKSRVTDCPANTNDKNNNDIGKVFPSSAKRSPRPSSETKSCGERSKVTDKRETIKTTGTSGDTLDSRGIIGSLRECSVAIIGEKCRVCGQCFKCIKDVQQHTRKKHKKKKPKTKLLLLKIGDEVISRVRIRRKHLKRTRRSENDLATMPNNDEKIEERSSWNGNTSQKDQIDEIRSAELLVVLEDVHDAIEKRSNLQRITERDVPSSTPGHASNASFNSYANDDQDIREVLRIRRSPLVGASINHETPNRFERELLLSDAIREFDRIANDRTAGMADFINDEKTMHDGCNDIVDDFCWLADHQMPNPHLDTVENSSSYHIRNDWDMEVPLELDTPMTTHLDPKYFDDEDTCLPSKRYPKDDYDIPDFIDYSECLNTRAPFNNNDSNNNSSIYGLQSPLSEKARTVGWNGLAHTPTTFNCDIRRGSNGYVDRSVLIKEEVMLDEVL